MRFRRNRARFYRPGMLPRSPEAPRCTGCGRRNRGSTKERCPDCERLYDGSIRDEAGDDLCTPLGEPSPTRGGRFRVVVTDSNGRTDEFTVVVDDNHGYPLPFGASYAAEHQAKSLARKRGMKEPLTAQISRLMRR